MKYLSFLFVLLVVGGYGVFIFTSLGINKPSSLAEFGVLGDSFGLVNTLFSGFAFCGIIITIILQRSELEMQRLELELTRHELAGQKEEFHIQNETLKQQKFENTFFQLMQLHNEILKGVKYNSYTGRDAFDQLYNSFSRKYKTFEKDPRWLEENTINSVYKAFYENCQNEVGHYFRNMYHIIKFIDESGLQSKKQYSNILRAQLSNNELALLFYNCISDFGSKKFKPLIETYSILKTLPENILISRSHKSLYSPKAFGLEEPL